MARSKAAKAPTRPSRLLAAYRRQPELAVEEPAEDIRPCFKTPDSYQTIIRTALAAVRTKPELE